MKYRILIAVFVIEFIILSMLQEIGFSAKSWFGNVIGTFIVILPFLILFFLFSKEEKYSNKKRTFFKWIFIFMLGCFLLGCIATLF